MNSHKEQEITNQSFDELMKSSLRNWGQDQEAPKELRTHIVRKAARKEFAMNRSQITLYRIQRRFINAFTIPPTADINNWTYSRSLLRSFDKDLLVLHVVG